MSTRLPALILLSLASAAASAQISTDRPGFGFSSSTVGARVFQVEAGTPQGTLTGGADAYAVPVALRYGVTPTLEFRLSSSVLNAVDADGSDADVDLGFQTVTTGVKVSVPTSSVEIAVIPELVIPTDGNGGVVAQVNVPASFPLGDFGLTLIPGLVTGDGSTQLNGVAVLSRSLGGALGGYVEVAAFPFVDGGGNTPVYAGAGVTALLTDDVQLDASFDAGLTDAAPNVIVAVGVSFRL